MNVTPLADRPPGECDVCGAESPVHVESHRCGGPHCMPKCAGCYEAEVLCECTPAKEGSA